MKKNLAKKVTLSILAGAVLMSSSVVWAGEYSESYWYKHRGNDDKVFIRMSDNPEGLISLVDVSTDQLSEYVFYGSVPDEVSEKPNEASGGKVTLDEDIAVCRLVGGYACDEDLDPIEGGTATGNTVTISKGDVEQEVIGGLGDTATNNTVNISGGTFTGEIVGGFALAGTATNNTVNINGSANLENAGLCGGVAFEKNTRQILRAASGSTPGAPHKVVGSYGGADVPNTLNIGVVGTNDAGTAWNPYSRTIGGIIGFDVINIYGVEWDEANPHITVGEIELKDTVINAYVSGDENDVTNKQMTLIAATKITKVDGAADYLSDSSVELYSGIANVYTGTISVDETENDIIIKLDSKNNDDDDTGTTTPQPERNNQVLVLGESRAAAVAFTNQGSELIETSLDALARDNSKDTKVFAAVYGNHSEYETGSHVNVNGWSGIVGIGKTDANGLTIGAFFENGEGNYSTHNIFTDDYIRGDGEANYNGGGLLVRKDNANGVYTEASLRAGNLQNELRNAVRNGQDLTGYDVDTFYYGAHIGIGKVIPRGADGDSLDVYGKFIYTHHDGETFDIDGTATKFDSVESERLRLGFRINEVQTNKLSMYYGAAWEYEFNGDAHDKIASFDLETPSLEGSTVIGEIGMHYKASEKWSFDLNGRAYTGQREGFSGSVQANYAF